MLAQGTALLSYESRDVAAALAARDHGWSVGLEGDGRHLMARVGIKVAGIPVYKHVELTVGPMPYGADWERVMLPVSWKTTGGPPIFPRMEGTLHVEPAGPGTTRLTLNATYDPPLGAAGVVLDRALMHRLAKMTMADFVERLARAVSRDLARV